MNYDKCVHCIISLLCITFIYNYLLRCFTTANEEDNDKKRERALSVQLKGFYNRLCQLTARIRTKVKPIYDHKAFFYIVNFVVICDVLYSTYYGHKRPVQTMKSLPKKYITIKAGLIVFYTAENFITGISMGLCRLKKSPYFLLSSAITLLAMIELSMTLFHLTNEVFVGISLLRAVTLVELFKLTRWWGRLKVIIRSLFETLNSVIYLFILLFIVLSNYALLGNQFFGDSTKPDNSITSGTFDTFGSSLLLTFVMLTGDNWTGIMFDTVQKQDNALGKICTVGYYISFVVIGNFILMNVFLGIIVDNLASDFEESHDEHFSDQEEKKKKRPLLLNHVVDAKMALISLSSHHSALDKHGISNNKDSDINELELNELHKESSENMNDDDNLSSTSDHPTTSDPYKKKVFYSQISMFDFR